MENRPQLHLMLDLETLSTETNAHLLEIAIVAFDPETKVTMNELSRHYVLGGLTEQKQAHVSRSTVAWWVSNHVEHFKTYFNKDIEYTAPHVAAAGIYHFLKEVQGAYDVRIWCTGTFDVDLLNDFVKRNFGETKDIIPFWAMRDVRTLRDLGVKADVVKHDYQSATHSAYEDCLRQIDVVCAAFALTLLGAFGDGRTTKSIGDQGGHAPVSPTTEYDCVADTRTADQPVTGADQQCERATENRRWEADQGSTSSSGSDTSYGGSDGVSTSE